MRLTLLALLAALSVSAFADEYVQGYVRKDGTYVPPHFRSSPNASKLDNFSTQGNTNPYTGERGYVNPYAQPSPVYQPPQPYQPYQPYQYQPPR